MTFPSVTAGLERWEARKPLPGGPTDTTTPSPGQVTTKESVA